MEKLKTLLRYIAISVYNISLDMAKKLEVGKQDEPTPINNSIDTTNYMEYAERKKAWYWISDLQKKELKKSIQDTRRLILFILKNVLCL